MMGCAIGMTLILAFEVFYWIFIKPIMKLIVNENPSPTQRRFSNVLKVFVFMALIAFTIYEFSWIYQFKPLILEKKNQIL